MKFGFKGRPLSFKKFSGKALGRLDLSFLFYNSFPPFKKHKFFSQGFGSLKRVDDLNDLLISYAEKSKASSSEFRLEPFGGRERFLS